ncbi:hypothetical protein OROGR_000290 [Orobanche gracilis]
MGEAHPYIFSLTGVKEGLEWKLEISGAMKAAGSCASTLCLISLVLAPLLRHTFATKQSYVVYLGAHSHGTQVKSTDYYDRVTQLHYEFLFLGTFLGSFDEAKDAIFYSYTKYINGFAATLDDKEAYQISKYPKVVSVFLNQGRKLHTTRSWDFLGLESNGEIRASSVWKKARFGEDTIIGNLDTAGMGLEDLGKMDWSEKNSCIKCDEGGNVLICSENGCPLAVHEGCMGCPARFDDAGQFYCPYCLYKQAVSESRQAREYAMARKKALLAFMDEAMIGREKRSKVNERAEANEHNQSKSGEAVNATRCSDDRSRRNSDSVLDQSIRQSLYIISFMHKKRRFRERELKLLLAPNVETLDFKCPTNKKSAMRKKQRFTIRNMKLLLLPVVKDLHLRCVDKDSPMRMKKGLQKRNVKRPPVKTHSPMHVNSEAISMKNKQSDKNKQTSPNVNSPRRSSRRSSSALRTEQVLKEKVEVSKRLKQPEMLSFKLANDTFSREKRKRLMRREEEEEMLKAVVQKYSDEPSKKLPCMTSFCYLDSVI